MSWTEPKTDWVDGDKFNLSDWQRITGNLSELFGEFGDLYTLSCTFSPTTLTYANNLNFSEVRTFNNSLYALCTDTNNECEWAEWAKDDVSYHPKMYTADELNAIESKELLLLDKITNQKEGRRKLEFNFGIQGGF